MAKNIFMPMDVEKTFFKSVSDQWILGLYIFENYEDLLSTLIEFKENENDLDAVNSILNDPHLDIKNFE